MAVIMVDCWTIATVTSLRRMRPSAGKLADAGGLFSVSGVHREITVDINRRINQYVHCAPWALCKHQNRS